MIDLLRVGPVCPRPLINQKVYTKMSDIKPIETLYDGYRFRSRLEARWAVYFKTLGIAYEYEKEGFDLGEAGWYLPDFWLPEFKCWLEVKGQEPTEAEREKAEELFWQHGHPVIMTFGTPKQHGHEKIFCMFTDDDGGGVCWFECNFVNSRIDNKIQLFIEDFGKNLFIDQVCSAPIPNTSIEQTRWKELYISVENIPYGVNHSWDAALDARSARFEFGERG